jgi:hypothetical protein
VAQLRERNPTAARGTEEAQRHRRTYDAAGRICQVSQQKRERVEEIFGWVEDGGDAA